MLEYGRIRGTTIARRDAKGRLVKELDKHGVLRIVRDPIGHTISKSDPETANALYCTKCKVAVAEVWSTRLRKREKKFGWCTRGPGLGITDTRQEALDEAMGAVMTEPNACLCGDELDDIGHSPP